MKAFVSYSFKDSELHIITLLFEQLRKSGYEVESSFEANSSFHRNTSISKADVFLGIVTNKSESIDHVIREWKIAKSKNIKNVLLIENGINVKSSQTNKFIRFSRAAPRKAINQLFNLNTTSTRQTKKPEKSPAEGALIGAGILVGLAALLSLLSDGNKK